MDKKTASENMTDAVNAVGVVLARGDVAPIRNLAYPRYLREVLPEVVKGSGDDYLIKIDTPKRGYDTYKRIGRRNRAIPPDLDVEQLEAVFTLLLPTPFQCVAVRNALEHIVIYIDRR